MWVHTSLSQGGFHGKGLWVEYPLASLPFGLQGAFLHMCGQGSLLTSRRRNMWSGQGPASPLNCPATLVFSFLSTGNESPVTLPCTEHLPPASFRGCQPQKKKKKKKPLLSFFEYFIASSLLFLVTWLEENLEVQALDFCQFLPHQKIDSVLNLKHVKVSKCGGGCDKNRMLRGEPLAEKVSLSETRK